jgi:signal transduction histidine kinase
MRRFFDRTGGTGRAEAVQPMMQSVIKTVRELPERSGGDESERMADMSAIAAQLAHDLGNPVSALSMQAQLLNRRVRDLCEEEITRPAQRIVEATERLSGMIRGFMDFARGQRFDLEELELEAVLSELVIPWKPVASRSGIAVTLHTDAPHATVRGDRSRLRRAFDNLIQNAFEAVCTEKGAVDIRLVPAARGRVRIQVDDNGPGVPVGSDVFGLFQTTKPSRTGVGLAVAKQIILAHGGQIEFANRHPHGASFRVELPTAGPLA